MVKIADITPVSLDAVHAYTLAGVPRFYLEEMQDFSIRNSQETQNITGKRGRTLATLKKNKAVTISGNHGLLSPGLLEAQTGSEFVENTGADIYMVEYLTIQSNAATTTHKAIGTSGAEITALYVLGTDGVATATLTQAGAAAEGKFAYAPNTKTLSFYASAYPNGTQIVVYYTARITGDVLKNASDSYSEKLRVVADITGEDKCGNTYHVQINIPKADFSGDFDLSFGDNQTVHSFEATSLASGFCGVGTGEELWTMAILESDAEDYVSA